MFYGRRCWDLLIVKYQGNVLRLQTGSMTILVQSEHWCSKVFQGGDIEAKAIVFAQTYTDCATASHTTSQTYFFSLSYTRRSWKSCTCSLPRHRCAIAVTRSWRSWLEEQIPCTTSHFHKNQLQGTYGALAIEYETASCPHCAPIPSRRTRFQANQTQELAC